jgi:hypothetical protein
MTRAIPVVPQIGASPLRTRAGLLEARRLLQTTFASCHEEWRVKSLS